MSVCRENIVCTVYLSYLKVCNLHEFKNKILVFGVWRHAAMHKKPTIAPKKPFSS
jgi:hypothetical protein